MKYKSIFAVILIALFSLWGGVLKAHDFSYTYQGKTLYYTKTSSNTVSVTYYCFHGSSDIDYVSGDVTIPSQVTSIDGYTYSVTSVNSYAFSNCSLTSVKIPTSVTSIESSAFANCNSLTNIEIPTTVTSIKENTFMNCSSLRSITIHSSINSIEHNAFYNCGSLDTIIINSDSVCKKFWGGSYDDTITMPTVLILGGSVVSINEDAFRDCTSLTNVVIDSSVTVIGQSAFENCNSLTSITIPNSVTTIGQSAFENCSSLTSITIPNSVTYIGGCAFALCTSLTSITIPNSVTKIDIETFYGCKSLRIIELPASLNNINTAAFYNCSKIHTIYSRNTTPPIVGKCYTFENVPRDAKLYVPNGSVEAYKQANVWKEFYNIKGYDFDDTTNVGIQDINISDNITLYPNPADKEINISLKNMDLNGSKIFIYDLQGNLVKSFKILDNKDNILLDISSLSKGTYTIVVVSDNKTKVTQKLIKR